MSNRTTSKKILIILGFLILAFFVSYYFMFQSIKSKSQRTSILRQELSQQSDRQNYLTSTQKMIENIDLDIAKINNSIVAKDGDVDFIENLEVIARSNGLTISIDSLVFEDAPALSSASLTSFKIKAKLSGSWSGTYTFLSQIESSPFKIKVVRFGMVGSRFEGTSDGKKSSIAKMVWQSTFEIVVLKYK